MCSFLKKNLLFGMHFLLNSCYLQKGDLSDRNARFGQDGILSKNSSGKIILKKEESLIEEIISRAKSYIGTPYRYGGNSKKGLDCSALILQAFSPYKILLPRISFNQAKEGSLVSKFDIKKGDLLFFAPKGSRNKINHVGLVVEAFKKDISFVHASSSKGVMISKLTDPYWKKKFVAARRIFIEQLDPVELNSFEFNPNIYDS